MAQEALLIKIWVITASISLLGGLIGFSLVIYSALNSYGQTRKSLLWISLGGILSSFTFVFPVLLYRIGIVKNGMILLLNHSILFLITAITFTVGVLKLCKQVKQLEELSKGTEDF